MLTTPWLTKGWLSRNYDEGTAGEAGQRGMFSFCVPSPGKFIWREYYLQNITKTRAPIPTHSAAISRQSFISFRSTPCFELPRCVYLLKPKPQPVVNTYLVSLNELISCTQKWPTKPDVLLRVFFLTYALTTDYISVLCHNLMLTCSICLRRTYVFIESNLNRHYNTKHAENMTNCMDS
jgi:hypothetical protein